MGINFKCLHFFLVFSWAFVFVKSYCSNCILPALIVLDTIFADIVKVINVSGFRYSGSFLRTQAWYEAQIYTWISFLLNWKENFQNLDLLGVLIISCLTQHKQLWHDSDQKKNNKKIKLRFLESTKTFNLWCRCIIESLTEIWKFYSIFRRANIELAANTGSWLVQPTRTNSTTAPRNRCCSAGWNKTKQTISVMKLNINIH